MIEPGHPLFQAAVGQLEDTVEMLGKVIIPSKHLGKTYAKLLKIRDGVTTEAQSAFGDLERFAPPSEEKPTVPPEQHGLDRGENIMD